MKRKLKQSPPFRNNQQGHCVVYAIANLLHGFPLAKNSLKKFPTKPNGYNVNDKQDIVKYISGNVYTLATLAYLPTHRLTHQDFFRAYPSLKEIANDETIKSLDHSLCIPYLFDVSTANCSPHQISGYYCLDTEALILMDSALVGSIWVAEVAQFFENTKVHGFSMITIEENGIKTPAFFDINEFEFFEL